MSRKYAYHIYPEQLGSYTKTVQAKKWERKMALSYESLLRLPEYTQLLTKQTKRQTNKQTNKQVPKKRGFKKTEKMSAVFNWM
jgi:transposase